VKISVSRRSTEGGVPRFLVVAAVVVLGLTVLVAALPMHETSPVGCPVRALTGLPCPGCGLLRSMHLLVHGRIGGALGTNPLATLLVALVAPIALALWIAQRAGKLTIRAALTSRERRAAWVIICLVVGANWIYMVAKQC
jgi:hypothetical protein